MPPKRRDDNLNNKIKNIESNITIKRLIKQNSLESIKKMKNISEEKSSISSFSSSDNSLDDKNNQKLIKSDSSKNKNEKDSKIKFKKDKK